MTQWFIFKCQTAHDSFIDSTVLTLANLPRATWSWPDSSPVDFILSPHLTWFGPEFDVSQHLSPTFVILRLTGFKWRLNEYNRCFGRTLSVRTTTIEITETNKTHSDFQIVILLSNLHYIGIRLRKLIFGLLNRMRSIRSDCVKFQMKCSHNTIRSHRHVI